SPLLPYTTLFRSYPGTCLYLLVFSYKRKGPGVASRTPVQVCPNAAARAALSVCRRSSDRIYHSPACGRFHVFQEKETQAPWIPSPRKRFRYRSKRKCVAATSITP